MVGKRGIGLVALLASAALLAAGCSDDDDSGVECGNGVIEGSEVCDGADLGGEDCASQGFAAGTLLCNSSCGGFDTSLCTSNAVCGNDAVEAGEECDGVDLDNETCLTRGHTGGTLACDASCSFDESGCTDNCGNGSLDPAEEVCDGSAFGTATCATEGFDGGALACAADCQSLITTGCCDDACPADGDTQCNGDILRSCEVQASGCLEWVDTNCAATGAVCDDSGDPAICASACVSNCSNLGDTQCAGNILQTCSQNGSCLNWVDTDCAPDYCYGIPAACNSTAPTGEDCQQAIALNSTGVTTVGAYSAATLDVLDTTLVDCYSFTGDADAVWAFTMDATSNAAEITINKSASNRLVAVILDDCLNATSSLACGTEYTASNLTVSAAGLVPGATYYLVIGNAYSTANFPDTGFTWIDITQRSIVCGDGVIDSAYGEACDDGNATAGDGCSDTCQVEPAWSCTGEPSTCTFMCGNGVIDTAVGENCDDGNATAGDGCSATCTEESGYYCSGTPSVCVAVTTLLSEDFSTWPPAGWTIEDGGTTTDTWFQCDPSVTAGCNQGDFGDANAPFAAVDSDAAGSGPTLSEGLVTPSLDCSAYSNVLLRWFHNFQKFSTYPDEGRVEVSIDGGSNWTTVQTYTVDTSPDSGIWQTVDISTQAAGQAAVLIRFYYTDGGTFAWYWQIDDVDVIAW